jgi:hypothetical protein
MMARYRMKTPLPIPKMPLWKWIASYLIPMGGFAAILTFFPTGYHPIALLVGTTLLIIGLIAGIYVSQTEDWRAVAVLQSTWPSLLFAIGTRALINQFSYAWIWVSLLLACYILAWLIPAIAPKSSALLWREQTNPQTHLGMGCMGIFTRFSATIMASGPLAGMYLSRYGYGNIAIMLVGTLLCPSAIAMAQIFSHQLWNNRPWAHQEKAEREGH